MAQEEWLRSGRCPEIIIGATFLVKCLKLMSQRQIRCLGQGSSNPKRASWPLAKKNVGGEGDGF